jgi:hypothetical protein
MKTCEWMERVAAAMDDEWTPEVHAHASACPECRELLADREWLRVAPEIPEAMLAEVRARVMERVEPPRRWWWAAAAAATMAVAGFTWWATPLPEIQPLHAKIPAPPAPSIAAVVKAPARTVRHGVRPDGSQPAALAQALRDVLEPDAAPTVAADGPLVVAMQTEDPTVVIVLVSEPKGDEE